MSRHCNFILLSSNFDAIVEVYLYEIHGWNSILNKAEHITGLNVFMVEDVVGLDSINSFVKFEVREFARFLEFPLINNILWTRESVVNIIHNHIYKAVFR
jgi:hypothetical protein